MRRTARGMTLIEVMVAVAIMAMLGAMTYGIVFTTVRTQDEAMRMQDRFQSGRVALERIRRELTMAFVSLHQSEDKRTQTLFVGERARLVFNSGAHEPATRGVRQSDQMEVEYRLHRPRGQKHEALVRRVKYHLDDRPERGGREEILVEGVRALRFSYFDKSREDWTDDWEVRIDDAQLMRARLRELQALREQAEGIGAATAEAALAGGAPGSNPLEGVATAVAGAALEATVDVDVAVRTQELLDGLVLPTRVRITLELDNEDAPNLVMQTQVEIPLTEPLWY
jgi:general secretion pathway protein J